MSDTDTMRIEYLKLVQKNDAASAGRLAEVATALGLSAADVQKDAAFMNSQVSPAAAAPDLSKMSGGELLGFAVAQQHAAMQKMPDLLKPAFDAATATTVELLAEGLRQRPASRLPQEFAIVA
jgi:hypothetical protein